MTMGQRVIFLLGSLLLASPAFAQQQPTVEEVQTQYLVETGQLRVALGETRAALSKAMREIESLKAKAVEKSEAKK